MYNNRPSIFQGRNGSDQLSVFLVAIALLIVIIYPFFPNQGVRLALCIVALALSAIAVFRMFSTNVAKRRNENARFLSIFKKNRSNQTGAEDISYREVGEKTEKEKKKEEKTRLKREKKEKMESDKAKKAARKEDLKTHSYFKCPKCSTELRVPKGKGKIKITCPKCGEQFVEKT